VQDLRRAGDDAGDGKEKHWVDATHDEVPRVNGFSLRGEFSQAPLTYRLTCQTARIDGAYSLGDRSVSTQ
jgi:hypothetical protein